jgi:DNA polymerase-3 subunit gamma/tau
LPNTAARPAGHQQDAPAASDQSTVKIDSSQSGTQFRHEPETDTTTLPVNSEPRTDDSIHWSSFAYDLGLQGLAQEIAVNSTLERLDEHHFRLNIKPEILKLADLVIEDEIRQAIASKLGVSLKLELLAQDELLVETPQIFFQRRLGEQRQAAIEEIKKDITVRKLGEALGAELVESSVRKIDEVVVSSNDE